MGWRLRAIFCAMVESAEPWSGCRHWIDFGGCVGLDPPLHFVTRRDVVSNIYYINDYGYSLYFIAIKRRAIASNSLIVCASVGPTAGRSKIVRSRRNRANTVHVHIVAMSGVFMGST